jgi:sensor histidine kinase YesM
MNRATPFESSRARVVLLLLAAWVAFFTLLEALSVALSRAPQRHFALGPGEVVGVFVWTTLSLAIASYHKRLRTAIPRIVPLIVAHLPMFLIASFSDAFFTSWAITTFTAEPPRLSILGLIVYYLDFDVGAYLVVVAVAEVLIVRRALIERQRQEERLEASLSRARLDYLEAQLQPHFLFNSLGAVSELAFDAPATATRVLRQLAAIFRTALGRKTDEVTLGEEIVGIEPYLDIQRIRFADWLTIDYQIDDDAVDCLVPRFVLQPLVENAIRHGLSGRSAAGTIEIEASVAGETLVMRVVDNGVGLDAPSASAGRGIGLTNVRDRLSILYGDDDSLRLSSNESGGAVAELRIPVRRRYSSVPMPETERADVHAFEPLQTVAIPVWLRRPVVAIPLIWFLCGLAWTQQSFLYLTLRGRLNGATWISLLANDMFSAAIWAAITPITFFLARRFPLRRGAMLIRVPVYVVFGGVAVIAHNYVWQRAIQPGGTVFAPQYLMSFVVGFLIMCMLVALGHRGLLADWLRARETNTELLRAELDEARHRAEKLQAIPPVLLRSLDGIAETARRDPALTERQLTRLADYLRLALECTDERGITPEREHALEAAVAELQVTGAYSLTLSA